MNRRFIFSRQEWALIAITVLWGGTFIAVHQAMTVSGPLFFVGVRFLCGGLAMGILFAKLMRGVTKIEILAGALIGIGLFLGYSLQSHGLKTINSSQSAFITALYVPLVPLMQWAVLRRPPRLMSWIGAIFAFIGLIFLSGPDAMRLSFSSGEIATLLGAFAIAAEIILIGFFAGRVDSRRVAVIQLIAGGLFSFCSMPLTGETVPAFSFLWLIPAIGLGLMSALIQLTMNWAQKSVSPTRATIIYAGEPVWGGIFGRMAGDRLAPLAFLGAAFILVGILVAELRFQKRPQKADH